MNAVNYYHLLDAAGDETTSQLGLRYMRKRDQVQLAVARREPGAEDRLTGLETAYRTLANPRTREAYDLALRKASRRHASGGVATASHTTRHASRAWWVAITVFAILAAILVGVGEHLRAVSTEGAVQLEIQRHHDQRPNAAPSSSRI